MDEGLQILAIAPAAAGWRAVLLDADDNKPRAHHVICWALVREPYEDGNDVGATTFVAPVIAELGANMPNGTVLACSLDGFVGLAGPGEIPPTSPSATGAWPSSSSPRSSTRKEAKHEGDA